MLSLWRLKHLPSGMYYTPARLIQGTEKKLVKSNLSAKGKVYTRKPSIKMLGDFVYSHIHKNNQLPVYQPSWLIEEVGHVRT